jgi:hypothetical protein
MDDSVNHIYNLPAKQHERININIYNHDYIY